MSADNPALSELIERVEIPMTNPDKSDVVERKTGIELHCDDCQSPYAVWFAPNSVWNLVMGESGGMLCPRCFTLRAEAKGVKPTAWEVRPENVVSDDRELLPCGWNANVGLCHWINCHRKQKPCDGISAVQWVSTDEVARLTAALAAAEAKLQAISVPEDAADIVSELGQFYESGMRRFGGASDEDARYVLELARQAMLALIGRATAIQTEQTMHAAWRKRAEEAESTILALREALKEEQERCAKVVREAGDDTIRAFVLLMPETEHSMTLEQFAAAIDELVARIRALSAYRGKG